jgi:hypothetical protein
MPREAAVRAIWDQRRGQAGAAATKRVTDRNRAAVDVQFCVVDAQLALAGGERLVQLEQVDAVERQFRAQKRLAHRGHGSEPHERGIDAGRGARTDEGDRLKTQRFGQPGFNDQQCRRTVVDTDELLAVTGSVSWGLIFTLHIWVASSGKSIRGLLVQCQM